ncbi:MAG: fused MFS/spermidine synthase [Chloroflexota bacterium]
MSYHTTRTLLLVLYSLSGISALIFQVTWVRQSTLVFGVSVYAYAAVLAAFMGGTALGSYLLGRRADQVANPLRLYTGLQLGIAITGFVSSLALTALMPLYGQLVQSFAPTSSQIVLIRLLFSILLLVPPTFLMGATLPAMARAYTGQKRGSVGSDVGWLYAAETLGAALGCGLTGLFLLRLLGTQETLYVAITLNVIAAIGAWVVQGQLSSASQTISTQKTSKKPQSQSSSARPFVLKFVLWTYALSGFVALGYEVAWARILAIFTTDAVFSFSIMLTTFLAGLGIGGWLGARWIQQNQQAGNAIQLRHFGLMQLAVGLSALLTLFLFTLLPSLSLESVFGNPTVGNIMLFEFLIGFIILILPTTFLGILFPIAVSIYTQEQADTIGADLGRLNAFNTFGAVLGSLAVGFILIPRLGLQGTVAGLAVVNLVIGLVTTWIISAPATTKSNKNAPPQDLLRERMLPQAGIALGIVMVMLLPDGQYFGFRQGPSEYMVYYSEGVETTVAVFDVPEENFKVSFVNGRIEVPTDPISMYAFRLLGHLPPILRPDAEKAMMLSFGNGVATGSLDTHRIPHIDAVDLSAQQFEAAEIYWEENYNVLRSPRLNTYVEDGRNFLLQTPHTYDIITTDATHPVNTSSWALFTQEFYEQVDQRLADDGVFMQWLPFHNLIEPDFKTIIRTVQHVFPNTTVWFSGGSHAFVVATREPLTNATLQEMLQAADNEFVDDDLGPIMALGQYWAMDADEVRVYVGEGPLVTDNNAYFLPIERDTVMIMEKLEEAVKNNE